MTLEKKLRAFFMKNDPGRVRLAKKMAKKFRGKDKAILAHLNKVYATGGVDGILERGLAPKNTAKFEEVSEVMEDVVEDTVDTIEDAAGTAADEVQEDVSDAIENVEDLIDDLDD